MFKYFAILSFFLIFFISCKKEKKLYRNEAVITGVDKRDCACTASCPCACGNLQFHFTDTTYQENIPLDNPSIFKLPTNVSFPVYVDVNWINTTRCGTFAITITDYKRL